jgi:hypothetical protein
MDKAKQAAMQAKESAQHVAQQGQAKVASVQQSRSEGELYRSLGEAAYAAQRRGGDQGAVETALTALDQHFASAEAAATTPPPPSPASPPPAAPPAGDFTLDDV